jgi:hypothetical protein
MQRLCDPAVSGRTMLVLARATGLFLSCEATGGRPGREEIDMAVAHIVRTYRGVRRCAPEVAAAFGDYPEHAARRMRWALDQVVAAYTRPGP